MRIKIIKNSWLMRLFFKKQMIAFTFGRTIRFRKNIDPAVIWHELCHTCQYEIHGKLGFLWIYFIAESGIPYRRKSFEIEAYTIHSKQELLNLYPQFTKLINQVKL